MAIKNLTKENFDEELNQEKLVIIDFWAPWCGPCQAMTPVFEQISNEFSEKAKFCKVNVDEQPEISQEFKISGIPSISFIKNKEEIERLVGFNTKESLKTKINSLL